jgi:hypothetical protein
MRTAFIIATLMITSFAGAQEAFLQLDSIVVLDKELNFQTSSGNYNVGRDTANISIGPNQYIKVRKVSFSFRSTNELLFNNSYIDFSIGTESNLFLDLASIMLKWSSTSLSSSANFRVDYLEPKSYKLEAYPNEFLTSDQEVFINYDNRIGSSHNVYYRIELVYFSYQ